MFLADVPNPHMLLPLSDEWLRPIRDYDPDLRFFPSQVEPVYRVARRSSLLKPMRHELFPRETVHPDTVVALERALVLIEWSLVAAASSRPAELLLRTLKARDTWAHRHRKDDLASDTVARLIEEREADDRAKAEAAFKDRTRQIGRAARLGVLYRTGQRVSLAPAFGLRRRADASSVVPAGGTV